MLEKYPNLGDKPDNKCLCYLFSNPPHTISEILLFNMQLEGPKYKYFFKF